MSRKYDKLVKVGLEKGLSAIKDDSVVSLEVAPGKFVGTKSVRLRTFAHSLVCVRCGLVGTHFWAERNGNIKYHINLYAMRENGSEALMTKDHIIPKSRGGSNNLSNMQTMCEKCNCKKGNRLEEGFSEENHPLLPGKIGNYPQTTGLPSKSNINRKSAVFKVGDIVCKKSRKAFQSKKRVAAIKNFGTMIINPELSFTGVILEGCASPVRLSGLSKDPREIKWLGSRDESAPLPYNTREEELLGNFMMSKLEANLIAKMEGRRPGEQIKKVSGSNSLTKVLFSPLIGSYVTKHDKPYPEV